MPQTITRGFKAMLDEANAKIETLSAADAIALHGRDDVVLVDLRDPRELERDGRVPGAFHCPRGMLEFWIDPESPYHKPIFNEDKRFVFFCGAGGARPSRPRRRRKWASVRSRMWRAVSPPGRKPAARWRQSQPRR